MSVLHDLGCEIWLTGLGIAGLLVGAFLPRIKTRLIAGGLAIGVLMALLSCMLLPLGVGGAGWLVLDASTLIFRKLLLAGTLLVMVLALESPVARREGAEFFSLLLIAAAAMLVLVSAGDFITLFVALEVLTLCCYVLTAYLRNEERVLEAGFKYLVMGALSASFLLYGIAYLYGASGQLGFAAIRDALAAGTVTLPAYQFGLAMLLAGLGFKLAVVPFQGWAPDVYQGAPTPASAFLATCSKVAGFAVLLRLIGSGVVPQNESTLLLLAVIAGATILYGTFGALGQSDLKRLLGYSSIAHAGYLMIGLAIGTRAGTVATYYYLVQYLFTVLCAFLVVSTISQATGETGERSYAGLYRRSPLLALALFAALMSLAGIPPLSGGLAKFFILLAAIGKGGALGWSLAGIGAGAAVVSLFFYISVLRAALIEPDTGRPAIAVPVLIRLSIGVCLAIMLAMGVWPRVMPLW